jgi:hypothetical protein
VRDLLPEAVEVESVTNEFIGDLGEEFITL